MSTHRVALNPEDRLEADIPAQLKQTRIKNRRRQPPAGVEGVLNGKDAAAVQRVIRVQVDLQPPAGRQLEHFAETQVKTRNTRLEDRVRRDQRDRDRSRPAGQVTPERMTRRVGP